MIKHLLFDLDGTLLPVDLDFFFRHYLTALAPRFSHLFPTEKFGEALMASTAKMVENLDPNLTNEEVFWQDFSLRTGHPRTLLEPIFLDFYTNEFPLLKRFIGSPGAIRKILEAAVEDGFSLILATNPIFPEQAIRERLSWIDCHDLPFALITSLEDMHFCKPQIEYYREIIEVLGLKEEECLMVGNDVEEDLVASFLGMKTCLVTDRLISRGKLQVEPDYRCRMEELGEVLKKINR